MTVAGSSVDDASALYERYLQVLAMQAAMGTDTAEVMTLSFAGSDGTLLSTELDNDLSVTALADERSALRLALVSLGIDDPG